MKGADTKYSFDQPDSPSSQVSTNPRITFTSVDCTGPLHVRNIYKGNRIYKACAFLMTCPLACGIG